MAILTDEARRENALALAAAAGLPIARAAERLEIALLISHDSTIGWAAQLADEVKQMLLRTAGDVRTIADATDGVTAELVIGNVEGRSPAMKVFLGMTSDVVTIGHSPVYSDAEPNVPPLLLSLAACYACAAVLHLAIGDVLPYDLPQPFALRFDDIGIGRAAFERPINIGRSYLAGAGAIGNAVLWAARHLDLRGELIIADDDVVDSGNLNRQIWFGVDDLGLSKAIRLALHAQPHVPALTLIPEAHRLQNLPQKTEGPWLARLLVAVDSRRARRELQNEFPGEVFDASTTDIREVVSFYANQPSDVACLSCVYEADAEEYTREHHIAEHLGVDVSEVRTERIGLDAAKQIASKFPRLRSADLVHTSYDTLFKRLCAEGELRMVDGRRLVAPFAFVSCLAGVVLVLDLVRRLTGDLSDHTFNYWRISAWHPPLARRREMRPKQPGCSFCSNRAFAAVNDELWGDPL